MGEEYQQSGNPVTQRRALMTCRKMGPRNATAITWEPCVSPANNIPANKCGETLEDAISPCLPSPYHSKDEGQWQRLSLLHS